MSTGTQDDYHQANGHRQSENQRQVDDPHLTLFSFFNVLNVLSGVDEIVYPASELFNTINQEYNQSSNKSELKDILSRKIEEMKHEETELFNQIHNHSKLLFLKEVERLDKIIDNATKRKKAVFIASKCAKAALSYLSEHLSDQKMQDLSNSGRNHDKRISSFQWFLQNTKISGDQNTKGALVEFLKFIKEIDENQIEEYDDQWVSIIGSVIEMMKQSRPDSQYIQLQILTEFVCKKDSYSHLVIQALPIIVKLLTSINDDANGEASVLLSTLAYEHKSIIGQTPGCIKNLIDLIWRSQSEQVVEKAVTALWNLAIDDTNKSLIREHNGIEAVCSLLKNPHEGILENSTIALGYLTRNDENKIKIRQCEGLKLLLDVLSYPKDSIVSKTAGALWNCASNNENKIAMREYGGIGQLVQLLDNTNHNVLENVTGTLWNCAVEGDNKREIYNCNGINKLVKLLSHEVESIVENASGTLWNCATLPEVKIALRKINAIQPLLRLIAHKNENIQENAAGAIRNFAMNDQNKIVFADVNGIKIFINLLDKVKRLSVLEKIVATLWICSMEEDNKSVLRDHQAFPKLIRMLNHSTPSIVEKALGTICNCSVSDENRIEIVNCGGIPIIVTLLMNKTTASIREYAATTIRNLARDDSNRTTIRELGGIKALVALLLDKSESVQENSAGALASLTLNAENRVKIREEKGLVYLVQLLSSKNEYVVENAISALKNCALNERNLTILALDLKIIPRLLQLLSSPSENITKESANCLKNLAANDDISLLIGQHKGVEQLMSLLNKSDNENIKKTIVFTLQTLTKHPTNRSTALEYKKSFN